MPRMSRKVWLGIFDRELRLAYAIGIQDTGWDEQDLFDTWNHYDPELAVDAFAHKYDLTPRSQF